MWTMCTGDGYFLMGILKHAHLLNNFYFTIHVLGQVDHRHGRWVPLYGDPKAFSLDEQLLFYYNRIYTFGRNRRLNFHTYTISLTLVAIESGNNSVKQVQEKWAKLFNDNITFDTVTKDF